MSKQDDPRLGSIIKSGEDGDIVLIGFPYDEGTLRNGGRGGAHKSPTVFRYFLSKMGCLANYEYMVDLSRISISDAGDVALGADSLEQAHQQLRSTVRRVLSQGKIPFVVGGSNDQSSSNGLALLDILDDEGVEKDGEKVEMGCVNIDAHLDVRPRVPASARNSPPLIHSGCPFRDLLEDGRLLGKNFVEFAAQGSQCSGEHARYLYQHKSKIVWLSEIRAPENSCEKSFAKVLKHLEGNDQEGAAKKRALFVSFDIDSISGSDCPGVSCPSTVGLSAEEALSIARLSGACGSVRLFDMSEMNVAIEDYRTPRLAVNIFYHFLIGYARRMDYKLE